VILLGVGARIALDPADHGYYTAGVLLGALLWDLTGMKVPIPLWTATSYAALSAVHALTKDPALLGALRLGLVVAFSVVIVLGPPWRRRWRPKHAKHAKPLVIPRMEQPVQT
jgi:hypothetical protein